MTAVSERREIVNKLKWFMLGRLILISGLLGVSPFALDLGTTPFFVVIGFLYIATAVYGFLLKTNVSLRIQGYLQFFVDVVVITSVLSFTGGIESGFVLLYVLSIASASIIIGGQSGVVMALACSALYAVLGIGNYSGFYFNGYHSPASLVSDPLYVAYLIFVRATIFCLLGFLVDYLTRNLKRNRLELDKFKRMSERILLQMSSGLITTDDVGRIIYANRAAEEILGYAKNEMKGRSWHEFLGKPIAEIDEKWLCEEARSFTRCQVSVRRKEGDEIPVGFTMSNLVDDDGKLIGLLILFRDLTQVFRMEERMRKADRLSAAGAILASVAHEVRNPLASIRGAVEVIMESDVLDATKKRLMDIILKESDRLDKIVSDYLVSKGDIETRLKREDVSRILKEVISIAEERMKLKTGVHLRYADLRSPVYAMVDAGQIKRVFYNILNNAFQALTSGGTVSVELDRVEDDSNDGAVARIRVSDTGEGMSADKMSRLFEPFYSDKDRGSGMGLFIAERIVRGHGGRIDVESRENKGTVLTITLPCERLKRGKDEPALRM